MGGYYAEKGNTLAFDRKWNFRGPERNRVNEKVPDFLIQYGISLCVVIQLISKIHRVWRPLWSTYWLTFEAYMFIRTKVVLSRVWIGYYRLWHAYFATTSRVLTAMIFFVLH